MEESALQIHAAVEGPTDEAVVRRILIDRGIALVDVHGKMGKDHLKANIARYSRAARYWPWVVLVDLDQEAMCASQLRGAWLPSPGHRMVFRVAVRQVESWLMADRDRIARFLRVSREGVPLLPDLEPDAKTAMLRLAVKSRSREVRQDMLPRPNSGRRVGPAYASRLIEFIDDTEVGWRPLIAAQASPSLDRALHALDKLPQLAGL